MRRGNINRLMKSIWYYLKQQDPRNGSVCLPFQRVFFIGTPSEELSV